MAYARNPTDFPISTQVSRLLNFLVTTLPNSKPSLGVAAIFPPPSPTLLVDFFLTFSTLLIIPLFQTFF